MYVKREGPRKLNCIFIISLSLKLLLVPPISIHSQSFHNSRQTQTYTQSPEISKEWLIIGKRLLLKFITEISCLLFLLMSVILAAWVSTNTKKSLSQIYSQVFFLKIGANLNHFAKRVLRDSPNESKRTIQSFIYNCDMLQGFNLNQFSCKKRNQPGSNIIVLSSQLTSLFGGVTLEHFPITVFPLQTGNLWRKPGQTCE